MNRLIPSMSVRGRLLTIALMFCFTLVGIILYTVVSLQHHHSHSDVENIASRQNMLIQMFTKELFDDLAQGKAVSASIKFSKTRKLFEVSLDALRKGGDTYVDLAMTESVSVPKNTDAEIDGALAKVERLWRDLVVAAQRVANARAGTDLYYEGMAEVRSLNARTHAAMNEAAAMFDALSEHSMSALLNTEWIILVLAVLLGLWYARNIRLKITAPLGLIVSATRKIAAGDLSVESDLRQIDGRDEFSMLAESYRSMLSSINKLQIEMTNLSGNVEHGNLDVQCDDDGLEGVWAGFIAEVNVIIRSYVKPFKEAEIYLDRISRGDIPPLVTQQFRGDFNKFKESFNRNISTVTDLLEEYNALIEAAHKGDLTARGDVDKFDGCWKEFIDGLNKIFATAVDPVRSAGEVLRSLSEGDLRYTMDGKYQGEYAMLQRNVNTTIGRLESTVIPVQATARFISKSADQIFAGNNSLSDRTDKQSSKLQETAVSMGQLTEAVRNSAENAKHANKLAASAKQSAEHGGDVVSRAVQAMDEINKSSNKIAEIIGVIDEIAFQTNLLALNASVEAARAGEQGRGFAVVATEVRNLAGRSATAAKEIKELIKDSMQKVRAGTSLVNESGETLGEIMDGVKQVGSIISEIDTASFDQIAGIETVNQAITSIDEMVEQNALLAERTSIASGAMKDKARELKELMRFFKVDAVEIDDDKQDILLEPQASNVSAGDAEDDKGKTAKTVVVPIQYVEDNDEWEEF